MVIIHHQEDILNEILTDIPQREGWRDAGRTKHKHVGKSKWTLTIRTAAAIIPPCEV